MTAPLSVNMTPNVNTQVAINDSCNCCWPFKRKRKDKNIVTTTDDVYHKTIIEIDRYNPEKRNSTHETQTNITSHRTSSTT